MSYDEEALRYHREPHPGKIEVVPTKPFLSQTDLSLAYTPGVAAPCREIQAAPDASFEYTSRGNLIAVISNGTAVLGLGNIGPLAGKPVMEGKAVLFKRFANIDVFDIEVNTTDPDEFIRTVELLEPTFGGINLEDIKAPDCFYIEEQLKKRMAIPVFHDDQHGTAIISAAAMLNAVAITGHKVEDLRVVINGAGAAGVACARLYIQLGVAPGNIAMVDSRGVIYRGRAAGMNPYKEELACETAARTLEEGRGRGGHAGGAVGEGGLYTGAAETDGAQAHRVCPGQPGSGNRLPRGQSRPAGCRRGHRPVGFSQPGEQCAGLPLHLSRGVGRAGHGNQRGHENCGRPGPGRTGPARMCPMPSFALTGATPSASDRSTSFPNPWIPACCSRWCRPWPKPR